MLQVLLIHDQKFPDCPFRIMPSTEVLSPLSSSLIANFPTVHQKGECFGTTVRFHKESKSLFGLTDLTSVDIIPVPLACSISLQPVKAARMFNSV
jgi:hypothetical protein